MQKLSAAESRKLVRRMAKRCHKRELTCSEVADLVAVLRRYGPDAAVFGAGRAVDRRVMPTPTQLRDCCQYEHERLIGSDLFTAAAAAEAARIGLGPAGVARARAVLREHSPAA